MQFGGLIAFASFEHQNPETNSKYQTGNGCDDDDLHLFPRNDSVCMHKTPMHKPFLICRFRLVCLIKPFHATTLESAQKA
jgi:hypothetical protein